MTRLRRRIRACVLITLTAWAFAWGVNAAQAWRLLGGDASSHVVICRMPHPPGESCPMMHEHATDAGHVDQVEISCDCCRDALAGWFDGAKAWLAGPEPAAARTYVATRPDTSAEHVLTRGRAPLLLPPRT